MTSIFRSQSLNSIVSNTTDVLYKTLKPTNELDAIVIINSIISQLAVKSGLQELKQYTCNKKIISTEVSKRENEYKVQIERLNNEKKALLKANDDIKDRYIKDSINLNNKINLLTSDNEILKERIKKSNDLNERNKSNNDLIKKNDALEKRISSQNAIIAQLENNIKVKSQQISDLQLEIQNINHKYSGLEDLEEKNLKLQSELSNIENYYQVELNRLNETRVNLKDKIQNLNNEKKELKDEIDRLNLTIKVTPHLNVLKQRNDELSNRLSILSEENKRLLSAYDTINIGLNQAENLNYESIQKEIVLLKESNNNLIDVIRKDSSKDIKISQLQKEVDILHNDNKEMKQENDKLKSFIYCNNEIILLKESNKELSNQIKKLYTLIEKDNILNKDQFVTVSLVNCDYRVINLFKSLTLIQNDPVNDQCKGDILNAYFIDEQYNIISNTERINANKISENEHDRQFRLKFEFVSRKYKRSDNYYFVVENHSGTEILKEKFTFDISFANEFDFF